MGGKVGLPTLGDFLLQHRQYHSRRRRFPVLITSFANPIRGSIRRLFVFGFQISLSIGAADVGAKWILRIAALFAIALACLVVLPLTGSGISTVWPLSSLLRLCLFSSTLVLRSLSPWPIVVRG
jgi:hypothetical protein